MFPPPASRKKPIIDSHMHVFPEEFREQRQSLCQRDPGFKAIYEDPRAKMATAEEALQALADVGADFAVVFGFPWQDPGLCRAHNDYVAQVCSASEKKLLGLGCLSPALGRAGLREARRCLEMGLKGIGEVATYRGRSSLFGFFFESLAELLVSYRRPLVLHVTESLGHLYPGKGFTDLAELSRWIQAHPELDLILAHWGGGIFFYELMPEVHRAFQRVHYDTAASPFLYRPDIYRVAHQILGSKRLLWGSDFPLIHPRRYLKEVESARLPRKAMEAILGGNAARLWKWEG